MSATTPGAGGPLTAVLQAFRDGVHSLDEVGERTGLARDVVQACVDHLVRLGRLEARELAVGCPTGGCGTCASATATGQAGCGAVAPSATRSGPALVTISVRRPA
ncbi:hypothetical protein H9L10_14605 [Phycicoccus endophyticus]|uniref:Transcriptional regulator HTH-type FeoC domain-containing protein n=1 Tax=Phycicoccus endophyticus TaxID=1690220 RepID=A0A7G9R1C4_9MICO|nr:hypothetical protein [Phycicoccus endophyticus]NHI18820.1 hypothetical protein [Phycicoccus endophyticus]QNN49399.1 hypothetical protein H9L10_14605 [Phycicoccus endophyticus]GGL36310.1 hypothetical protein GCM10012283_18390 [Phycicoccus endophyticus]